MAASDYYNQVHTMFVGYFGRPPAQSGLDYYAGLMDASGGNYQIIVNDFYNSAESQALFNGLTIEQQVNQVFINLFGRDAAPAGLNYWSSQVLSGVISVAEMSYVVANNAQPADAAILAAKVATSQAWVDALDTTEEILVFSTPEGRQAGRDFLATVTTDTPASEAAIDAALADMVSGGSSPDTFFLTAGSDRLVGTANDDTFLSYISQNETAGGVSNTLSSGDNLDGGHGTDSLFAEIVPEFFGSTGDNQIDVQPRTKSIEVVEFEARELGRSVEPDEEVGETNTTVTVDAKHMYGVTHIGSKQSDGDLVIENLTTLANDGVTKRNTSDLTITMDHTDNFNTDGDASDLHVYFDDNYLISGQTAEGRAFFFLLDEDADLVGNPNRLDRINVDGIRFSFDGGVTIVDLDDPAAQTAGTHEGFVAALQGELAAQIAAGNVPAGTTLTLDPTITDSTFLDNGQPSLPIPAIVLTSGDGSAVTPIGFSQVEETIGEYDVYGRFNSESSIEDQPVSVDIELTKVGRGDDGGDLIVGAKSQENGIEVFDVTVMGGEILPNSLGELSTTDSALGVVNIRSEAGRTEDFASLEIRDGFGQSSLELVNANEFYGDLALGTSNAVDNLVTLTATGGGDIAFFGELSDDVDNDTGRDHSYTTGAGDDWVEVGIDGDAVDAVGESLTITTGAGSDGVEVQLNGGVSQRTMYLLDNLSINTGAGQDGVYVWGMGLFDVSTGADSDFVQIDSSIGNNFSDPSNNNAADAGEWIFGTATGAQTFVDRVLYQADLTVKFAGLESTVRVITTAANNFVATQLDINTAIMAAIDASPELWAMLDYETGSAAQQLFVDSLVKGNNDLAVSLYQPELLATGTAAVGQTVVSSSVLQQIAQGIIATTDADSDDFDALGAFDAATAADVFNNGTGLAATNIGDGSLLATGVVGTAGTAGLGVNDRGTYDFLAPADGGSANGSGIDENDLNFSVINMGAGANDIVVLDNNDGSANTLVIDQVFGKVSVVNFFDANSFVYAIDDSVGTDYAVVGFHRLDFTAYLNNQIDASTGIPGNGWSAVPLEVTLNADVTAEANSVTLLGFDGSVASSVSFASLSGANLLAVLNGTAGAPVVGGLGDGDLNAATSTLDLVGTTQNHIVLVENEQNQGEYKVFHLTSLVSTPDNGGDFASATLLGTLDFGYSIDGDGDPADGLAEINLVGSAAYLALDLPFPV